MSTCLSLYGPGSRLQMLKAARCCQICVTSSSQSSRNSAAQQMETYWQRNRDRNRPLSPHLGIHKFHIPMALSISNRVTASVVTGAIYLGPLIYLFGSKDYAGYMELVKSWGSVGTGLVGVTKFSLAFCFSYHFAASMRHLAWDNAMGFQMDQVYKTGYALMAATLILTAILMNM